MANWHGVAMRTPWSADNRGMVSAKRTIGPSRPPDSCYERNNARSANLSGGRKRAEDRDADWLPHCRGGSKLLWLALWSAEQLRDLKNRD
jgi:hypothetical protein